MNRSLLRAGRAPRSAVVAVLLVLGLAACSGEGGASDSSGGPAAAAPEAAAADRAEGAGGDLAGAASEPTVREIITTGRATLVADDPAAAAQEIARLVERVGGRVESRDERAPSDDEPGWASLTLRIPADEVTATVDALDALGEVEDVTIETDDVTGTAQDLDARIAALETSTERLRGLMAEAGSVADLLEVERQLTERQADLDALQSQRDHLSDQVAMSTLTVTIHGTGDDIVAIEEDRPGFLSGLTAGWHALVNTVQVVVLVVGVLLPWLAAAAAVLVAVGAVRRAVRRRRAADSQGAPAEPVTTSVD